MNSAAVEDRIAKALADQEAALWLGSAWCWKGRANLRDRHGLSALPLASLTRAAGVLTEGPAPIWSFLSLPLLPMATARSPPSVKERNSFTSLFPLSP